MLSLDLGVYGFDAGCRNSPGSMEEVFLTVLGPSSVQIVYRMRSINISKSGVHLLTGRYCNPCGVEVECVSGLAHSTGRRTILLKMPQRTGDQQMIGSWRQIYGHFGYERLVLLLYREYYPNLLPMIVLSAPLCRKDPIAEVVNKGSPCLTHAVAFILSTAPQCLVTCTPAYLALHPSANPGVSTHSNAPMLPLPARHDPHLSLSPTLKAPTHTLRE